MQSLQNRLSLVGAKRTALFTTYDFTTDNLPEDPVIARGDSIIYWMAQKRFESYPMDNHDSTVSTGWSSFQRNVEKTNAKEITLTNQHRSKKCNEPIRIPVNDM